MPFRTGTLVSSEETSASPSSDSTSTPRQTASGNSKKRLREIQRLDQKLCPFKTGTLVWSDDTYTSRRSDSTSTPRKTASGKSSKILRVMQLSDQKLWPFRTGALISSDENAPHRLAIPDLLQGKQRPELLKKFEGHPQSDQKLWPFRTGTLVWTDDTYTSPSSDSTSTPRKTASGNS
jgi:hypothetical protein